MNELALFAGAGGGILGGAILGWRTVCAVERDAYCASILAQRQNDGALPAFPIWSDVSSFDGRPWRGIVDVVSGGFPCQDISLAGKGAGIDGARSGLWRHMARIIGEVRPRYALVENSPALITRGLDRVTGDLSALGYDCRWTVMGAADVGAPHQRDRIWIMAHANSNARNERRQGNTEQSARRWNADRGGIQSDVADASCERGDRRTAEARRKEGGQADGHHGRHMADASSKRLPQRQGQRSHNGEEQPSIERADWWLTEPGVGESPDGLAESLG